VLKSVRDEAEKPGSLLSEKSAISEFSSISDGCKGVLVDIQKLLAKYNGLAGDGVEKSKSKKLWHRMRFGTELDELGKFRWKIIMYTSQLAVFLDSIHLKSSGRVEKATERVENKLVSGFNEVMDRLDGFEEMRKAVLYTATKARASERYTSVASIGSVLSLSTYADDDKEVWKQFRSELVGLGFRSDSLDRHREVLKAYMMRLDKTGVLDEAVVQEGKSNQPWCMNSFFRLTATELPQIDENDEFLAGDEESDSEPPTPSPLERKGGIPTEPESHPEPQNSPTTAAAIVSPPTNIEKSSPQSSEPPPSRRKRVTRQKLETADEDRTAPKEDVSKPGPLPVRIISSPVVPTVREARSSTPYQTHGGEKTNPFSGRINEARRTTPHQAYGAKKLEPFGRLVYGSRRSTPYVTLGGEKLNVFDGANLNNLNRWKSQGKRSNNYQPRYSHVQPLSRLQPQVDGAKPKQNIARLGSPLEPGKLEVHIPSEDHPEASDNVQHPGFGPPLPYAESYHSDTRLASSQSTVQKINTKSRESLSNRPGTRARPSSWHGPESDSDSDTGSSFLSTSSDN
jgi:hypothetical protein